MSFVASASNQVHVRNILLHLIGQIMAHEDIGSNSDVRQPQVNYLLG